MSEQQQQREDVIILNNLAAFYVSVGKSTQALALLDLSDKISGHRSNAQTLRLKALFSDGRVSHAADLITKNSRTNVPQEQRSLFVYILFCAKKIRLAREIIGRRGRPKSESVFSKLRD